MTLTARPCTLKQANTLVQSIHRHHKPVRGHRFSIAAYNGNDLCGVVIVGRPVARMVDAYNVAEVTRLATDGTRNACSFLYGRAAAAAKAMGFTSIHTYILESETGASLRAAGWTIAPTTRKNGEGWNNRDGRRTDQPTVQKTKYVREFAARRIIDATENGDTNG